jgi:hypothetical protein
MSAQVTKLEWKKPKVVVVETVGPLHCCTLITTYDGRKLSIPGRPIVTNTTDDERKEHKARLNRNRSNNSYRRKQNHKACYTSEYDEAVIDALIKLGYKNTKTVNEALKAFLADTAAKRK